jgi:cyclopropane-fatty-acyl-phospholipid synthase
MPRSALRTWAEGKGTNLCRPPKEAACFFHERALTSDSSARVGMMQSALDIFLRRFITVGRLTERWPNGGTQIHAGRPGPEAGVLLRDRHTVWRLILNPKLSLGEAYMDGGLVPLGGTIHDLLAVVLANLRTNPKGPLVTWLRRAADRAWRPINQFNARPRARRSLFPQGNRNA